MRTDIIGNEDLHPEEGYHFAPRATSTSPSRDASSEFPLNTRINSQVTPTPVGEDPPAMVSEAPMPKVRKGRSKLIFDTMVGTRGRQLEYSQRKRAYDRAVKVADQETEQSQIDVARAEAAKEAGRRRQKMAELRETYTTQFEQIEARKRREVAETRDYEAALTQQYIEEEGGVKEQEERRRAQQIARRDDFVRQNEELLKRKEAEVERAIEYDRTVLREQAELQAERDARAAEDVRRRLEKTNMRAQVCEARARDIEEQQKKQQQQDAISESAFAQSVIESVKENQLKQERLDAERHTDWIRLQKEKDARRKTGRKLPFPAKHQTVDAEEFARNQKKLENLRIQAVLTQQVEQRRAREQQELEDDMEKDRAMLEASQAEFDKSLSKLQTLIPPEAGIQVPKYTVSKSITRFN
jgi:hypothetical protein